MAYNPQKDLNEIVYRKGRYTSGDDNTKKWAQESAGQYYKNLMDNGYGDLAEQYKNMDYSTAYNDYKTNYSPNKPQKSNNEEYINTLRENANTMLDAEFQKQNEMYQRDMDKTTQRYNDAKKDSYFDYRVQNQHINQQLGANGITGGAAESTIAANANNYLTGLTALDKEKNSAISDIEAEKRAAYYDQISKKAQNEIDFAREGRAAFESDRDYNEAVRRANIQDSQWQLSFDNENDWRTKEFGETQKMNNASIEQFNKTHALDERKQNYFELSGDRDFDFNKTALKESNDQKNKELQIFEAKTYAELGNYAPLGAVWGTDPTTAQKMYEAAQNKPNEWSNAIAAADMGSFGPLAKLLGITEEQAKQNRKNMIAYENSFNQGRSGGSRSGWSGNGGWYDSTVIDAPVTKPTNTLLDEGRGPSAPPTNTHIKGQLTMGWNPWIVNGNNPYDLNKAGKDLSFISE